MILSKTRDGAKLIVEFSDPETAEEILCLLEKLSSTSAISTFTEPSRTLPPLADANLAALEDRINRRRLLHQWDAPNRQGTR